MRVSQERALEVIEHRLGMAGMALSFIYIVSRIGMRK